MSTRFKVSTLIVYLNFLPPFLPNQGVNTRDFAQ